MTSSNIRRFNDLDKRKLDIEDIDLEVDWTNEPFRIKHLKISDEAKENILRQGAGTDCKVYLDVECDWIHLRFSCGTVEEIGTEVEPTDQDGSSLLPLGVPQNAKFRVTIVGSDKSIIRESPDLPSEGGLEDLIIMTVNQNLGSLPYQIKPPSVQNGKYVYVEISPECWSQIEDETKREQSAVATILHLESVRSAARSFSESIIDEGHPHDEEAFIDWISYFSDTLGVDIPSSQNEDRESLRDWENKVVKSLANILNASKILKLDLENGGG